MIWTVESLKAFEAEIGDIYQQGSIRGPVHLSGSVDGSQEKALIDVFKEVGSQDYVFSTHRSHYHAILHGIPPELVRGEILAGRSIHLNFPKYRFFTSAIVGGCLPIALGVALGIKRIAGRERVFVFVGDMASQMGVFSECHKYARNFELPIVFVVEDNGISTNTPTDIVWGITEETSGRVCPDRVYRTSNWPAGKTWGGVWKFSYTRLYPHIGTGDWVDFDKKGQMSGERTDVMA
ncbi:MAG: thiamine pyrophosphate-dependent enzyme [Chloroflexota bacterium]|nr:thiamine pyrophosphate-dependent enzyme [Chloroflexota bacterium]